LGSLARDTGLKVLSFLEMIELSNGDIALRRNDEKDQEPMVIIRFSDATRGYLGDSATDVARALVQAGVEAAAELQQDAVESADDIDDVMAPTIH
jgi:hypothetical protein